ncbi:MAG TPA: hypothetical protein VLZ81_15940, partial [Blastocatellia bacterium]|nr:hypothetical protein [Blastocatellia bacterium]
YVQIGSSCNVCTEDAASTPVRAAIYQYNADGTGGRQFAMGLRNAEGLAILPGSTDLWVVVNERDDIAYPFNDSTGQYGQVIPSYVDNHPPDEFTRVVDGGNYGWPFCDPDPDTASGFDNMPFDNDFQMNQGGLFDCAAMNRISKGIPGHSAPLSLTFLLGTGFSQIYQDGAVVCLHGSWDRQAKTGYKVAYFPWNDSAAAPGAQIDLINGWLDSASQQEWGRPVDSAVDAAGNLYVSDDLSGTIYELSPTPSQSPPPAPVITAATKQDKNIVVTGQNFDAGAVVLINGQPVKTVIRGAPNTLVAKKGIKLIPHGQTANLQVKDSSGTLSAAFPFTRQ